MIRIFGTTLAALLGLAFGSFLNVCLSRWPEGESVVKPRSHCRSCGRALAWWENVPLVSWIALRGRCRTCGEKISWRYPLVELAVGALWAIETWRVIPAMLSRSLSPTEGPLMFLYGSGADVAIGQVILFWLLIALAVLDSENLWLPNWLTIPGIILGVLFTSSHFVLADWFGEGPTISLRGSITTSLIGSVIAMVAAGGLILLIRWSYWLIRRREGIGLGDAKLMAMLGAWLGLSGALLSFVVGVMLGAVFALVVLAFPKARRESDTWLLSKMPLGTFLCVGGIVSVLWGQPLIAAYLHLVGIE
jgi:leader peptidase (prepilin peptidase)/N-methyltransferase